MNVKCIGPNQVVLSRPGLELLISYETPVAIKSDIHGNVATSTSHSRTTSKHIAQWFGHSPVKRAPQERFDELLANCDFNMGAWSGD